MPYVPTTGTDECREAIPSYFNAVKVLIQLVLNVLVTDGASMAWKLSCLAYVWCRRRGTSSLMFNPSYTNYDAVGLRIGRKTVTVERELNEDGEFELPSLRL